RGLGTSSPIETRQDGRTEQTPSAAHVRARKPRSSRYMVFGWWFRLLEPHGFRAVTLGKRSLPKSRARVFLTELSHRIGVTERIVSLNWSYRGTWKEWQMLRPPACTHFPRWGLPTRPG
ncbi:mCG145491, isoform CRA_a, partial [Mus musculus]